MNVIPATLTVSDRPQPGDRVLSIRQPWSALILAGLKKTENRTKRTHFRGRIWLHASAKPDASVRSWSDLFEVEGPPVAADEELAFEEDGIVLPALSDLVLGCIIGSCRILDCVTLAELPWHLADHPFASGPFCWVLDDVWPLAEPIPAKGKLGLWTWK